MPIYDLFCLSCSYEEELFTSTIKFDVDNKCPKCDIKLSKKMGRVQVIYKGAGFYATEYGKSQHNSGGKNDREERDSFVAEARKESSK